VPAADVTGLAIVNFDCHRIVHRVDIESTTRMI
jgi:hypothetical protein